MPISVFISEMCDSSVLPWPHIVVQMTLTMAKIVFHPNNPVTLFSEDIDFTIFSHLLTQLVSALASVLPKPTSLLLGLVTLSPVLLDLRW